MWLLKSIYARRFTLMFYFLGSDGNTYRDHKDIIFFIFIVLVIVIFLLGFSLTCSVGFSDDNSKSRIFSFSCILIWVDLGSKTFSTYIVVRMNAGSTNFHHDTMIDSHQLIMARFSQGYQVGSMIVATTWRHTPKDSYILQSFPNYNSVVIQQLWGLTP